MLDSVDGHSCSSGLVGMCRLLQGYATKLLRVAMAAMVEAGIEYAALHAASKANAIYRSLGFSATAMPIHLIGVSPSPSSPRVHEIDVENEMKWSQTKKK